MGGMASDIYGQLNDFTTDLFIMHSLPGGQCTSWTHKGYTFDTCFHHLMERAFPLLVYSWQEVPFAVHLARHGNGAMKEITWPIGFSTAFSSSIADRYENLGGKIHYCNKVDKILAHNGRAIGIRLVDGTEEYADYIISNTRFEAFLLESPGDESGCL